MCSIHLRLSLPILYIHFGLAIIHAIIVSLYLVHIYTQTHICLYMSVQPCDLLARPCMYLRVYARLLAHAHIRVNQLYKHTLEIASKFAESGTESKILKKMERLHVFAPKIQRLLSPSRYKRNDVNLHSCLAVIVKMLIEK